MSYRIVNRDPEPEPPSPRFLKVEAALLLAIVTVIVLAVLRLIGWL